ncbi:glycoside hydrolase family 18 protein [Collybiopsis luxurians FD-317 M1]|uniref:chitinase n=1 Tax=Collybiopsis luxurians FD-317 M1 TaxID=944289 RepID=A0A0D0C7K0_9AGAR|nr:glycoside hydrolase family 18 protein [Collybiopsis luxurians FD-317 M1]
MRGSSVFLTAGVLAMTFSSSVMNCGVWAAPAYPRAAAKAPAAGGTQAAPHFVVYTDKGSEPAPDASKISGFNTVAMSFLLTTGAADQAKAWETLPAAQKSSTKAAYQKAGIKLIVSAFGSTDLPTSKDPKATAGTMAKWVKDNNVDGIDVDYEDLDAMNAQDGKAEQWLIDFTNALRAELPQNQYILTHAPLAPWFSGSHYKTGAYTKVDKEVGSKIDWYNLQYYNQGTEYTTCAGLITSSPGYPGSAVMEIIKGGVSADKVVIGKPGGQADATTGYMAPADLAKCVEQAKGQKWNGGIMSWEYPEADSAWIKAAKGSAFN